MVVLVVVTIDPDSSGGETVTMNTSVDVTIALKTTPRLS